LKRTLLEALGVSLIGALLAFAANALSPRGLSLSRNYRPALTNVAPALTQAATNSPTKTTNAQPSHLEQLRLRLQAQGFQMADSNQAIQLFHDPRREQERILFVDARTQDEYQAGHIPGALLLDYYHMEPHLPGILQASTLAEQIVLYCNGGECEDSELAAILLKGVNVPKEKLCVYAGGMNEWTNLALPVELGPPRKP
jgi:rhodanese-related sulfurtransferase